MYASAAERRWMQTKARLEGERAVLMFKRFVEIYKRHYDPDQPRVPAGEPGAGQWAEGTGEDRSDTRPSADRSDGSIILVGGFEPGDENKTVQEFMSANCQGRIRARMPGQFLDMTIGEVQALDKAGNRDARSCIKLLGRDEYRK